MFSFQMTQRLMLQGAIHAGYRHGPMVCGSVFRTGFFGVRWVSEDNNNAMYICLNNIRNAKFRYFTVYDTRLYQ